MLTRSILRALCALLVGFLLVSNPTDMTVLLVQIIGGLFALSGVLSIVSYFIRQQSQRRAERKAARKAALAAEGNAAGGAGAVAADADNAAAAPVRPTPLAPLFPVVGVGSLAFGAFLLCFPVQFVSYLMYVLGGLLVLIGVWQVVALIRYRAVAPIGWTLFVLPLLIVAAGVVVICFPMQTASVPFTLLGIGYILYGVAEFFYGVRFYHFRRLVMAEQQRLEEIAQAEEAHEADAVEITEATADAGADTSADTEAGNRVDTSADAPLNSPGL